MPLEQRRTLILKDKDGNIKPTEPTDSIAQSNDFIVTCDSPRCAARNGKVSVISWNKEAAGNDPSSVPDDFFRIIQILPDPKKVEQGFLFCSKQCAKDYLEYAYVTPLSPREQAAIQANNAAVEAKKGATIIQFPTKAETPVLEPKEG